MINLFLAGMFLFLAGMFFQITITNIVEKQPASITIIYFTLGVLNALAGYYQIMKIVGDN
jgi:hypothetical protein